MSLVKSNYDNEGRLLLERVGKIMAYDTGVRVYVKGERERERRGGGGGWYTDRPTDKQTQREIGTGATD